MHHGILVIKTIDALHQWSPNFLIRELCIHFFGPPQAKVKD